MALQLKPAGDFSHIRVDAHTDCVDLVVIVALFVIVALLCELPAALCSVFARVHPVVRDHTEFEVTAVYWFYLFFY